MRRLPLRKRKNRKVGRHERHLLYVQIHHIIRLHTNCIWQLSRKHHNTKTLIIKRFVVHAFYSRTVSFLASKTKTQALGNHVKHQDSSNLLFNAHEQNNRHSIWTGLKEKKTSYQMSLETCSKYWQVDQHERYSAFWKSLFKLQAKALIACKC